MHSRSILFVVLAWSLACSALPLLAKSNGASVQTLAPLRTHELMPRGVKGLSFLLNDSYSLHIASDNV